MRKTILVTLVAVLMLVAGGSGAQAEDCDGEECEKVGSRRGDQVRPWGSSAPSRAERHVSALNRGTSPIRLEESGMTVRVSTGTPHTPESR